LQQSFGIKTAGLEEKSTACQMLVCYARELKEGFANYTQEVVNLMVPLLKFYFHDGRLVPLLKFYFRDGRLAPPLKFYFHDGRLVPLLKFYFHYGRLVPLLKILLP